MKLQILFRRGQGNEKKVRTIINYSIAILLPVTACLLHIFYPLIIDKSLISLIALIGIGISAWTGGYKAGIITTVFFALLINLPVVNLPPTNTFLYEMRAIPRTILLVLEGIFLSFLIDLGSRQEMIRKYKIREKQLLERIYNLQNDNVSLQKEIRVRDEVLSIASHELKTPLTSMLLQTQTALHNIKNVSLANFSIENLLKMLGSVEQQTKRLSKMINELFNISVMTTGNLHLEREMTDLSVIAQNTLNDFENKIEREKYSVTLQAPEPAVGRWDKIRIEQAVSNLISNAIKYGNKKPIKMRVKKTDGFAEFTIQDHGIGISKSKQREIFGLFERGVTAEEFKGLGVGLYITQQIAEAHEGSLHVTSHTGQGSTFTLKLPLYHKDKEVQ